MTPDTMDSLDLVNRTIDGRVFTVEFIKRTDGALRVMTCRRGVCKGLTGRGMAYDPFSKGLFPVYDMKVKDYRMINLSKLVALRFGGSSYAWDGRRFVKIEGGV